MWVCGVGTRRVLLCWGVFVSKSESSWSVYLAILRVSYWVLYSVYSIQYKSSFGRGGNGVVKNPKLI